LEILGQPCVNGGTCYILTMGRKKRQTVSSIGYYCQCPTLYTGTRCESLISLCGSNPCQNNGTCYQDLSLNIIRCLCASNYTICANGGTCRVNSTSSLGFACTCPATVTGTFCDVPLDQCHPSPCFNNGTCVSILIILFYLIVLFLNLGSDFNRLYVYLSEWFYGY
jgi:Notch-like protein